MSAIKTVSFLQQELRRRLQWGTDSKNPENLHARRSVEDTLIEKLDVFLSSIEHRLDRFDQYIKISDDVFLEDLPPQAEQPGVPETARSRRLSLASLLSLKHFSMYNLNKVYEQLSVVKDQVLKTSVLNLEYLYKALDDKYNYLFPEEGEEKREPAAPLYLESLSSNRELLANKIITNLTYFEQKLSQIDALVQSRTPQATANYDADARFSRYRFFNFNRALRAAQEGYLHYYQLPLLWRENRYIIHGYRFNLSHREMWRLMLHLNHNELANIWTHICGAAAVCYLGLVHFPQTQVYTLNSRTGNVVMYLFLLAALACLVSSVLWHTYLCFAQLKIRNRFACVDYTGITVLITCSVVAAEYCSLYNYAKLLYSFMAVLVALGIAGFIFNWSPYFDRPECRPLRIGFFVSLAFLGATTSLCKWYYEGIVTAFYFYAPLVYKSFVWYWIGVVFYGGLIPERWRYDIIINEDDTCAHDHSALEVLMGNMEHSGEEELREVQASMENRGGVTSGPRATCTCASAVLDDETMQQNDILKKHFPESPMRTPFHRDFLSLWWVDYIFQSHNIWHVFVVLGVVGHYFCLLGMYEEVQLQHGFAGV
ncbi:HlyIII-domain-containing protein [Metschnikowia bicuspidata var. bicuspidata NRRL YB-4993]|uniref:HlyIII-domain-containing protein n=1 Tax=Metschnikowia bicuspidata var. bicuspidata NRRL YB-4993 TaxID=869754 RepID=A0A1A0HDN7_9ASCO|nr:HlyIII-domain-containing protein [Metschnikowia bicuspidata var. bicuspidata NRRL YB-4993]OBA22038.1 HlyIII-domain-containing protein [Metschnikowia bicuspidata var. bicuspidata NRRL YB-4993]